MALEQYCAACTYMKDKCNLGKYYCEKKGEYRYASDAKCYNFCEAYSRSNYSRQNMYENSRNSQSTGCYLTTAMCNVLGFSDNNHYLNTLRKFRNNVMQPNPNYIPLLLTYDIIGPEIAKNLNNDPDKELISKVLFHGYIEKAVTAIEESKNQEAINIYTAMTTVLGARYHINTDISMIDIKELDISNLGHGYTKKLIPTND